MLKPFTTISSPGPSGSTLSAPRCRTEGNANMHINRGGKTALKIMSRSLVHTTAIGALALAILGLSGCGSGNKEPQAGSAVESHVVPVEVAVAGQKNLIVTKTYSGTLEGEEQANIVSKISERVTNINVRVGQVIEARHVTLTLDKSGVSSQYY